MAATKPGIVGSTSRIAQYLTKQIDALQGRKNQREIAAEIGYDKPNMISMFKRGETKVPIEKIPALAKALHVDSAHLFRLAMEQYWPEMHEAVHQAIGNVVTENEYQIVNLVRELSGDDPHWTKENLRNIKSAIRAELDKRK
jgi:transcriptional regulator with XRE-family HTH domain